MASDSPVIIPPQPDESFLDRIRALAGTVWQFICDRSAPLADFLIEKSRPFWLKGESRLPSTVRPFVARYRRKVALGLGILLALLFLKQCVFRSREPDVPLAESIRTDSKPDVVPVKVFKVGKFNYEDTLNTLGTIKGAVEFKLSFEVPGVISSINYREGERYEEGSLLVSLKQDDILLRLKRAQAELSKAEADGAIVQRKYDDHKKLFEIGAIPQATLDNAKLEVDKANFASESARLEAKANEVMLEKSNLYAPSKGMIGELNVEEGEAVSANTLLGTHIMTEYVYAEFGVVERDVNKIQLGQKARVFVDAYPDKTFEGVIENIAPVVAGKSRTATVRVRLENPDDLLLPGMFARVRILLYSKKNTLAVPTDTIQGETGHQFVYVADSKKNIAEKRAITVGYTRPDYSQIDSGLSEAELVAASGLEQLEDKKQIKILETQEAEI